MGKLDNTTTCATMPCRIAFLRTDGTPIGKPMTGRWADTPEPRVAYVVGPNGANVPVLTNPQELKPTVDVYPGDSELLDVAVRVGGEVECYGWNGETFFYKNWRNPNWQFDKGIFLVEATV